MIKVTLSNEILKYITEIEKNRYKVSSFTLSKSIINTLRKNSKKKSSYASNKIEGNPLSYREADEAIEKDERKHFLKPEVEIRNYFKALEFLEKKSKVKTKFSKQLILDVQKIVEKGASKEKIGIRGPMPPGVLFAVYDSSSGKPDYIPPEYKDINVLLDNLVKYVNNTDDHPLIIAAIVHYELVTIHPFEDGNGRTARLLSGYILDLYGYGFNGIGSLEEYFAYDVDEYYQSLQMKLPLLYYDGRNNPPHPEIWINYFLRMVLLYSNKVSKISSTPKGDEVKASISYLNQNERKLLQLIIKKYKNEFSPIELSKEYTVTNRTIINWLSNLVKNGFVEPLIVKDRIRTYRLSEFTSSHIKSIINILK